jgi:hypothetical protein
MSDASNNPITLKYEFTLSFTQTNLELIGNDNHNKFKISKGRYLLTKTSSESLIIKRY